MAREHCDGADVFPGIAGNRFQLLDTVVDGAAVAVGRVWLFCRARPEARLRQLTPIATA